MFHFVKKTFSETVGKCNVCVFIVMKRCHPVQQHCSTCNGFWTTMELCGTQEKDLSCFDKRHYDLRGNKCQDIDCKCYWPCQLIMMYLVSKRGLWRIQPLRWITASIFYRSLWSEAFSPEGKNPHILEVWLRTIHLRYAVNTGANYCFLFNSLISCIDWCQL